MTAHFVHLLEDLRRRLTRMGSLVEDIVHEACEAAVGTDRDLADRVIARDADVDAEEVQIETDVIRLMALYQPVGADLRLLCAMLKINNDLERIADCAVNMAERARHVDRGAMRAYRSELTEMGERSRTMLRNAVQSFAVQSVETAVNMSHEDDTVDALYGKMINRIVAEGASSPEDMASRLDILSVAKNLERIADHATNVAEDVVFLSTGHIIRHGEGPEEFGGA